MYRAKILFAVFGLTMNGVYWEDGGKMEGEGKERNLDFSLGSC